VQQDILLARQVTLALPHLEVMQLLRDAATELMINDGASRMDAATERMINDGASP
jgi:hypothetical protein